MDHFYGWERANLPRAMYAGREWTPRRLYAALKTLWSRDSCAPRLRHQWTRENPSLGQCSITAFLAQDIFGGQVYGVPLADGGFHCWNEAAGVRFDLTSEQFGAERLHYDNNPRQLREAHFIKEEKRLRYEGLKRALLEMVIAQGNRRIALTFDDGPNTETTPRVLDILEENGVSASFFLIGDNITAESALAARRAYDLGCEINNHSTTHGHMSRMTARDIREETANCTDKILSITGEAPRFFRPPYIDVSPALFEQVDMTFICGSGCRDWVKEVSARERIDAILSQAADGQILLLHDMRGNENTVEAIREAIPELKRRGFRFVTCGQLFAESGVLPVRGRLYTNVYQTGDRA